MADAQDPTPDELERAERIRRLQERRGTVANRAPGRSGAASRPTAAATSEGRRRRHHYHASRILLAGLSVTGFFSILAALGMSQPNAPATTAPAVTTPAGPTGTSPAPSQSASPSVRSAATPSKSTPSSRPVTRSHGS